MKESSAVLDSDRFASEWWFNVPLHSSMWSLWNKASDIKQDHEELVPIIWALEADEKSRNQALQMASSGPLSGVFESLDSAIFSLLYDRKETEHLRFPKYFPDSLNKSDKLKDLSFPKLIELNNRHRYIQRQLREKITISKTSSSMNRSFVIDGPDTLSFQVIGTFLDNVSAVFVLRALIAQSAKHRRGIRITLCHCLDVDSETPRRYRAGDPVWYRKHKGKLHDLRLAGWLEGVWQNDKGAASRFLTELAISPMIVYQATRQGPDSDAYCELMRRIGVSPTLMTGMLLRDSAGCRGDATVSISRAALESCRLGSEVGADFAGDALINGFGFFNLREIEEYAFRMLSLC